jgi:hypothetical protein
MIQWFIEGFNVASGYLLLRDFHDWLFVKTNGACGKHHWSGPAFWLAAELEEYPPRKVVVLTHDQDRRAARKLLELVVEFLDAFNDSEETHRIYRRIRELEAEDEARPWPPEEPKPSAPSQ